MAEDVEREPITDSHLPFDPDKSVSVSNGSNEAAIGNNSQKQQAEGKKDLNKFKLKSTPSKDSILQIKAQIEEKEKEKREKQETFNLENLKKIWEEYADYSPTQSVKSALNHCELELEDNDIVVYVPNSVTHNTIAQENMLIEKIRETFHKPDISMSFRVSPERFPDVDQNLLSVKKTQREILKEFYDSNHAIKDFMEELGLKIEDLGID